MLPRLPAAVRKLGSRPAWFLRTTWTRTSLKAQIQLRGGDRMITLDGCQFDLRGFPDSLMKLELLNGGYEQPERSAVARYLPIDLPVVELGGCIGVVSCITNKRLQNPQAHLVVEANPHAVPYLAANRDRNQCSFKIVNRALTYDAAEVTFNPLPELWGNSLNHRGVELPPVTVKATQLGLLLEEQKFHRFALICDIEGHEYELVMREPESLKNAAMMVLEVHPHMLGEEKVQAMLDRLATLGFRKVEQLGLVVVLSRS